MSRAEVKKELIKWVREDSGLSVEVAAKKAGTSVARVEQWESGELQPTIRQLRLLAKAAKRPLAVFYLDEPPKKFKAMKDFRRMPGDPFSEGSTELRLAIRSAISRHQIALDIASDLDMRIPELAIRATIQDSIEAVAAKVREYLGVGLEEQQRWSKKYDPLNGWRAAIEAKGVLVFQSTGIELEEMRGFSISDPKLPVIVLNIKDTPNGRSFTLLHEFCHLILRQGGMCDLVDQGLRPPEEDRIEIFCNAVAGETIVPSSELLRSATVLAHESSHYWEDDELEQLARTYSVSREVVLRRLLSVGKTTNSFYAKKRNEYLKKYAAATKKQNKKKVIVPQSTKAVSYGGPTFARMVLDSYYSERITSRDVSEYLGVKLKHLPKIEKRLLGRRVEFGPRGRP